MGNPRCAPLLPAVATGLASPPHLRRGDGDPERRIDVAWNKGKTSVLPVKIRVICHDVKGVLALITMAITNCEANISSAHVQSTVDQRGENTFEVNVVDLAHLHKVMNAIMKVKGVIKVERLKQ